MYKILKLYSVYSIKYSKHTQYVLYVWLNIQFELNLYNLKISVNQITSLYSTFILTESKPRIRWDIQNKISYIKTKMI